MYRGGRTFTRGQSDVIGYVFILGIMIVAVTITVLIGGGALDEIQTNAQNKQAELVLSELDSAASTVGLGNANTRRVALGIDHGTVQVVNDTGRITLEFVNSSTGTSETILDRTLGEVRYTNGDLRIAYQGGGVWRTRGDSSVMVSPPEVHYRSRTLTMPLLTVNGSGTVPESLVIRKGDSIDHVFPNRSQDQVNPVLAEKVVLSIQSEYYTAWGDYFESRTNSLVQYDHPEQRVTVTLAVREPTTVGAGMIITGGQGGGTFQIQSGGSSVIDSYNSSALSSSRGPGSPPTATGDSGDVTTTLDVDFSGNAEIHGNLTTAGTVDFSGRPAHKIMGLLSYGHGIVSSDDCSDYVAGGCSQDGSVEAGSAIDGEVNERIDRISGANDNSDEPCFTQSDALTFDTGTCGSTIELDAGDYYTTQNLVVDGGNRKLLLDTTQGDIEIAVDEGQSVAFQNGANVTVIGDGQVEIYDTEHIQIKNSDTFVWNRGWDANQLWLYCTQDCQVQVDSGAPRFVGVVYAPADPSSTRGQVQIKNQATVFGAIVGGGSAQLQNKADIHFDEALRTESVFGGEELSRISYLHVTVNEINVTAG